jgi:hypothetical protein
MTQQERMAQMFAATDDDGRRYVMAILTHEYQRTQRTRRPILRVIQGGSPVESTTKSRASVRTKRKESA